MTEIEPQMDPHQSQIDGLLRRSMTAPIPSLPQGFDQRVMRKLHRNSEQFQRYRRILFTGYGVTSVVASAVIMHGQGLGWTAIAGMILAPLALVAAARSVPRPTHVATGPSAR